MALQRDTRYPGRYSPATPEQPQGAFKNRTTETSQDGSYLEKDWLNDFSGFFSSLLDRAGISPNGSVDEVGASQYFDSLLLSLKPPSEIIFESSGTYTPSENVRYIEIIAIGGGGGAGGVGVGSFSTASTAGAGAGTVFKSIESNDIESSYNIIIGAGGPGGAAGNNNGSDGGSTSVTGGALNIIAGGGGLGFGSAATSGTFRIVEKQGSTGSGGDYSIRGGASSPAIVINGVVSCESQSGGAFFGGEVATRNNTSGLDADTWGAGGGAVSSNSGNRAGGSGYHGVVIIKEYF